MTMTTTAPTVPELLSKEDALALTVKIRQSGERLWSLLHQAYDGRAWEALGYKSFGVYVGAEFDLSKSSGNRLVNQGRVIRAIATAAGVDENVVPVSARQARRITPQQAVAIGEAVREVPVIERSAALREAIATRASTPAPETPTTGVGLHEDRPADNDDAGLAELAEDVDWEAEASRHRPEPEIVPEAHDWQHDGAPVDERIVPPVPVPTTALKADQAARTLSRILLLDPAEVARAYMAAPDDQLGIHHADVLVRLSTWANAFDLELEPF